MSDETKPSPEPVESDGPAPVMEKRVKLVNLTGTIIENVPVSHVAAWTKNGDYKLLEE